MSQQEPVPPIMTENPRIFGDDLTELQNLKSFLKKDYIEPEEQSPKNSHKSQNQLDFIDISQKEDSNKSEDEELNRKPIVKKARKIVKNSKEVRNKENNKRFLSVFDDSEEENEKNAQNDEENEEIDVQIEQKPKKVRKIKKKNDKEFGDLLDADGATTQDPHSQEKSGDLLAVIEKKGNKVKLVRKKATKITKEIRNSEENQAENSNHAQVLLEENSLSETEQKLSRLKKRSKKPQENLIISETPPKSSAKKPKKARNPKKNAENPSENIEENGENTEKKLKKIQKPKKTEKIKGESTQEIFERLRQDPLFVCESEEDDKKPDFSLDNHEQFFGLKKDQKKRATKNHMVIKTRNKFFNEININECNGAIDEQPNPLEEEEFMPENTEFFMDLAKKPKPKMDMHIFLDKFQKFKEERALNVNMQPNTKTFTKETENIVKNLGKENEINKNFSKENDNNIFEKIDNNNTKENDNPIEITEENDCVVPRQGDLLLNEPITDRNVSNSLENHENNDKNSRKITNLKATSQELSQFLNNTFSNFSLDETSNLSLQISIPTLTKMNSGNITDTTLFVNRLARGNSFLNTSLFTMGGFSQNGNTGVFSSQSSQNMNNREHYKSKLMDEIRKRKSRNLNLKDLQDRFKQTDWTELTVEKQRNYEKKAEEKETKEEEEDEDYKPEDEEKEVKKEEENFIDNKKMIELEEGEGEIYKGEEEGEEGEEEEEEGEEGEEENEEDLVVNNEEKEKNNSNNKEIANEKTQNSKKIENDKKIHENLQKNEIEEINKEHKINENIINRNDAIIEEDEELFDGEEKEAKVLKKLRRIAENAVVNYKEEKEKRKAERKARFDAKMNDPQTKKIMQNLFEMEAEVGSDNEENDDIVKNINKNDDGERESDGEVDEELKGMIDNLTTAKEGEGELLWKKFHEDILKQDKENLKKVLERAFNIRKRKDSTFEIGDDDRMKKVFYLNYFSI